MGTYLSHIDRLIVIGTERRRALTVGRQALASMPAVDVVPTFYAPSTGGFSHRRDRAQYLGHLEALRLAVARQSTSTVISESGVPSAEVLAQMDGLVGRLPADWSVAYVDQRTGRWSDHASPRLYVVSQAGAARLLDYLTSTLAEPRDEPLAPDALGRAMAEFGLDRFSLVS